MGSNGYKKYLRLNSFTQQYNQASQGFQYNTESPEIEGTEELVDTSGGGLDNLQIIVIPEMFRECLNKVRNGSQRPAERMPVVKQAWTMH